MLEESKINLLVPTQEEELNTKCSFFVLLLYPMASLSTDTAYKNERILTQNSKYFC